VLQRETGIFKFIDGMSEYMVRKDRTYKSSGSGMAQKLYPYDFGLGRGVRAGSRWPHIFGPIHSRYAPFPFLPAYASSLLQQHGFRAEVMDCVSGRQFGYGRFVSDLEEKNPDIVVIETSEATECIDIWLSRKIAKFARVALAGPHVSDATVDRLQGDNPHVTFFLKGEYILSALEMARTLRPGAYESTVVKDLDAIPFPDRSFPGALDAVDGWIPFVENPQLQIWGSKGCPFKCTFCLWPQTVYKNTVSLRKPVKIMEEIREAVERYGFKHIYFDDDTFNLGNERISELCGYLKAFGLPWGIMARIDASPLELFEKMIACGCTGMKFGVESFDAGVRATICKSLEHDVLYHNLAHLTRKYPNVRFHLTMMRGLPGQSEAVHKKDMQILEELGFMNKANPYRSYQLSACRAFPGTSLHRELGQ
jgi:radical SAM superfamily enzyme YgiQ (UPF0313 family)